MTARHVRPRLQLLEGRDTPGNLTVSFAAGTLTVTGTDAANDLTITGDAADPTHFILSSTTDNIGGAASPFATPSGVKNLVVRMAAGNDTVAFPNSPPIKLAGGLTIDGGEGANSVFSADLTVAKGISIRNGTNAAGLDVVSLLNLNVGGGLTVANGDGNSETFINRGAAGLSTVGGSVSVTNGAGLDAVVLSDLNVGGNVTVRNGRADATGSAGATTIYNTYNVSARSLVRGSVSVSYLDGTAGVDGVWDADIGGNVAFSYGAGQGSLNFDGFRTGLPVLIRGNLSVASTGATIFTVGVSNNRVGAVVGRNLRVTTGAAADTLEFNRLTVNGATTLSLGDGNNAVTIDDSLFAWPFALATGTGTDTVKLDTVAGTGAVTTFNRAVKMSLGAGTDSVTFGGATDAFQAIVFGGGCTVRHGAEGESSVRFGKDQYPFGGGLQWVV